MINDIVELERCVCGHKKLAHGLKKNMVPWCGPCIMPGCSCVVYTWDLESGPFAYEGEKNGKTLVRESVCL